MPVTRRAGMRTGERDTVNATRTHHKTYLTETFMQKPIQSAALLLLISAATPALALDCGNAKTSQDRALCADPSAQAADAAMTTAYRALFTRLSGADKTGLLLSQRAWLKSRAYRCPDSTGKKLAQCLAERSLERQRFLEGRPETGPGSGGRLVPVFIETPDRKGYYEIDVTALKYAPPTSAGETLFNSEVDKLLKQVPPGKNDSFGRDRIYSFILHIRMVYASPQLTSAHIDSYDFSGGAHGNGGASNINIDPAKTEILHFADVFPEAAKPKLDAECLQQILKEKAKRLPNKTITGDDLKQLRTAIDDGLGKLDSWSFSTSGAIVDYDAYALGAYVEGPYSCTFNPAFLRPLVNAGFALP